MTTVDKVILVGSSVAIGIFAATVVAFYQGILLPIRHDMNSVQVVDKREVMQVYVDDGAGLQQNTYNPQEVGRNE